MIKKLIKKLYFKVFPERADVSKEYVASLEAEIRAFKHLEEYAVGRGSLTKKTLHAERLIERDMYEMYKHNPDYMKFVKEDLVRLFLKAIEDRINVTTEESEPFVRIIGRLDLWEEE